MSIQTLRPKDGLKVPNPKTGKPLKAAGERVRLSTYWLRRLRDGDVEVVKQKRKVSKPKDGD